MTKKLVTMGIALCLSVASTMTAFAGWEQTGTTWKYKDDSTGTYLVNSWNWIDGNNDGISECYYMDSTGVMASNTSVDGWVLNDLGQWTVNGVVQTKVVQPTIPQPTTPQPTQSQQSESALPPEVQAEIDRKAEERAKKVQDYKDTHGGNYINDSTGNGTGGDSLKDADINIGGF